MVGVTGFALLLALCAADLLPETALAQTERPEPPSPTPSQTASRGPFITPKKLKDVKPVYPEVAKQARVQGVIILQCTISPQGRVLDVKVLRGIPLLNEAAITAVRQWVYTPRLVNGVPVPAIIAVTVPFKLSEETSPLAKPPENRP
jgi:TonB family protein